MRSGIVAYAACLVVGTVLGLLQQVLLASVREGGSYSSISGWLDALSYVHLALGVGEVASLLWLSRGLVDERARSLAGVAAALTGAWLVIVLAQQVGVRTLMSSMGVETMDVVFRVVRAATSTLACGATGALLACLLHVVHAGGLARARPLVLVAGGVLGLRLLLALAGAALRAQAPWVGTVHSIVYWGMEALLLAVLVVAWLAAGRAPEAAAPPAADPETGPLDRAWEGVHGAIGTYLGGAGARVAIALLSWLVMLGARGAKSLSDLQGVRGGVIVLAVLSGVTSLVMLAAVLRLSRAPVERAQGPAGLAAALMAIGLLLDIGTTVLTAKALGGDLSSAFFAQKALPVLGALGLALGVGVGISLLRSFGALAEALALAETTERASSTVPLLAVTGLLGGGALLGANHLPVALFALLALACLGLAIAVLVQFIRVATGIRAAVRLRRWGAPPSGDA